MKPNIAAALIMPKYDSDAQAFFNAVIGAGGTLSSTEKNAVNQLVLSLKSNSLWSHFYAIYPMVGGSSTSCKFNLKDPRDLDAAFRLTFTGSGWTFASTGAKPDGASTTYADTHLIPNTTLSQNSASLGYWSRTSDLSLAQPIGAANAGYVNRYEIAYNSGLYGIINTSSTTGNTTSIANTIGLMSASRTSSTNEVLVKNGVQIASTSSNSSSGLSTSSVYLGAEHLGTGVSLPSKWECAFAFMADGFTSSQLITLDGIVVTFNTTNLGR